MTATNLEFTKFTFRAQPDPTMAAFSAASSRFVLLAAVAILLLLLQGRLHRTYTVFTSTEPAAEYATAVVCQESTTTRDHSVDILLPTKRRQPRRKVVLLGPHDRFNFGDLLFEKVVSTLLVDRVGYRPEEPIRAGIVTTDMSEFGGPSTIFSLKTIQKLSHASKQPFDIVYLGGEAAGCPHGIGWRMLPTRALQESAKEDKVYECAYLFPKEELVAPDYLGPSNMAVVNALGRVTAIPPCQVAIDSADYRSFRNPVEGADERLVPDSAVMTRQLFCSYVENVDNFPDLKDILSRGDYIAVQHKERDLDPVALAAALDPIARETNCSIVFFAAGTVHWHDSFDAYRRVANRLNSTVFVLDNDPNVWKVVATVAHAKAVMSTSLHVRIMAFQFQKPRVTWCNDHEKHYYFIKHWEQLSDDNICFPLNETAHALRRSVPMDEARIKNITDAYLASFDEWSNMLLHGHRKNVTRI